MHLHIDKSNLSYNFSTKLPYPCHSNKGEGFILLLHNKGLPILAKLHKGEAEDLISLSLGHAPEGAFFLLYTSPNRLFGQELSPILTRDIAGINSPVSHEVGITSHEVERTSSAVNFHKKGSTVGICPLQHLYIHI